MDLEGEYRLQTRESAEWEGDRRSRYQRISADAARIASDRATEFCNAVTQALHGIKLLHGKAKVARKHALHFGLEAPATDSDAVPIGVRDGWSVTERSAREETQAVGTDSRILFVHLPRQSGEELQAVLASHAAAGETLVPRPQQQTTPEGIEA
jgi:hypothetical protein